MAYLGRDPLLNRPETLPTIGDRTHLRDQRTYRRGITTLDDTLFQSGVDRHVKFSSTGHGGGYGRDPYSHSMDLAQGQFGQSRKELADLQDQVNLLRDDVSKKDHLISRLSSLNAPHSQRPYTGMEGMKIDDIYSSDRMAAAATARSEAATLQVKVDSLQSQLREAQAQINQRETKIRELTLQLETTRENEAKHTALTASLRQRMVHLEAQAGSIEGAASRGEIAVSTLQTQLKDSQDRILELESRLRTHLEDKERAEQRLDMVERKFKEMSTQFTSIMHVEDLTLGTATTDSIDHLIARLTEIVQDNAMLKGKLVTMKEYISSAELETKASRETIMRLVSEAEREQRNHTSYSLEVTNLRVERDNAVGKVGDLEKEIVSLKDRLDASQRAWTATRQELENREGRLGLLDREARDTILAARSADGQLKSFKEQLSSMLTDSYATCEPFEEHIRERIRQLQMGNRDKAAHIDMLEQKLINVKTHIGATVDRDRDFDHRNRKMEAEMVELEERLRRAEAELAAGDVMRGEMRGDKERYLRFLQDMSAALKMDEISRDMGIDMMTEAIMARADQLIRMENDSIIDRTTHIKNLQRKIKNLKDQLDSKDLHMDLLRKKVTTLEERLVGKSDLEREKDNETMRTRKLVKLAERYKRELNESNMEVRNLKARLLESSDIKSRTMEQEREIEQLESKVGQLEHVRHKQADKIASLKEHSEYLDHEFHSKRSKVETTVQALTRELKTTKQALDEVTKREKQLLDLRAVVSRMLGLDVNTLAVPDYEIISRLEKLILAQQTNSGTMGAINSALMDMNDGFMAGYESGGQGRLFSTRTGSPTRRSRPRTRTRSMSPTRKRDPRAY